MSFVKNKNLNADLIYQHLLVMDEYFLPRLSSKVDLKSYAEKLSRHAEHWFVMNEERIVALLSMYCNNPEKNDSYISNVSVLPQYAGRGIAKEMLIKAIAFSKRERFKNIKLEVAKNNVRAYDLYSFLGFTLYEDNDSTIIMTLSNE